MLQIITTYLNNRYLLQNIINEFDKIEINT